jgi:hypothetical protein
MLGSKLKSANRTCRAYLQVANILQDGMLRTADMPDPKYLPSILGGCNSPDAYQDSYNTYLYMKAYKGGGYDRLYGTATEEVKQAITLTERGQPTTPLIAQGLRGDHELFFATMKNKVFVPPESLKDLGEEHILPAPIYEAAGSRNDLVATESRLISTRKLVKRTQAKVLYERSLRLNKYTLSHANIKYHEEKERCKKMRLRACFHNALRGNSAFVNLANRKGCEGDVTSILKNNFKMCVYGQPEFTKEHAVWLSKGGKGEYLTLNDLTLSEDIFLRKEVSGDESMKVSGIRLNVMGKKGFLTQTTVAQIGMYQINEGMRAWADRLEADLENFDTRPIPRAEVLNLFFENREWVNDDTLLIGKCTSDCKGTDKNSLVALISQDKRLANQMARTANLKVMLVDPISAFEVLQIQNWNANTKIDSWQLYNKILVQDRVERKLPRPLTVYCDTGSIMACLSKIEATQRSFVHVTHVKTPIIHGINKNQNRFEIYDLVETTPNTFIRFKVFLPESERGARRKKSHAYSNSSGSTYTFRTNERVLTHRVTHRLPRKFKK